MPTTPTVATSTTEHRIGWVLTGLVSLLLLVDAATKLARAQPVLDSFAELGWAEHLAVPVGLILLVCPVLFSVYLGVALWAGLVLRDGQVRALLLGR